MTEHSHCVERTPSRNPKLRRPRCLLSFDEHLERTEAFAVEVGRLPLQRRCKKVGMREAHLGQWMRSIIAKARVGSPTLTDAQLIAVLALMSRFPQKHENSGPMLRGVTDHQRLLLVANYRQNHQRLPRLFGNEDDPEERLAGHALTQLRTRYRQSRRNQAERTMDALMLEKLDVYLPGWAAANRDEPKRRVPRYRRPEHAALLAHGRSGRSAEIVAEPKAEPADTETCST